MIFKLTYKPFGEQAILIEWPKQITTFVLEDLICFKEKIKTFNIEDIKELRSAYQSLLIIYKEKVTFHKEVSILKDIYRDKEAISKRVSTIWRIPVCYDEAYGLDLKALSKSKKMTITEIVKRHTQVLYTVYFIGFLPGFLYLGGLDDSLSTPRKSIPRQKIEKGAVAIGGNQTGVYPSNSPGGWQIIGKTPLDIFNVNKKQPCFAKAGDCIRFYPITLKEFQDIKVLVDAGVYQIISEENVS